MNKSIYEIKINDIKGKSLDMHQFKGKKWLIVNVASECGYTKQYAQLEELIRYHKHTINILACPCNDFGNQEPGTANEIEQFCTINYEISFPISEKIKIAENPHELYHWLLNESRKSEDNPTLVWNFHKFLIDEHGHLIKSFASSVDPLSDEVLTTL